MLTQHQDHVQHTPHHTYSGMRLTTGRTRVYVDGEPLPHIMYHSPSGMEWGYAGSGPADLALSILAHYFQETGVVGPWLKHSRGEPPLCWKYHQRFKRDFVQGWPDVFQHTGSWKLTSTEIDLWFDAVRREEDQEGGKHRDGTTSATPTGDGEGEGYHPTSIPHPGF